MGSTASILGLAPKHPMKKKIKHALKIKLKEMKELQKEGREPLNFTRILLKFSLVRKVVKHVKQVFSEYDSDNDGKLAQTELQNALQKLQVQLSAEEIQDLFNLSDLGHQHFLNLKEFLVALTVGYVLEVIPDLHSEPASHAQQLAEMSIMIRNVDEDYSIGGNQSMTEAHIRNDEGKTVRRQPKRRRRSSNFYGLEDEICYVMHLIVGCYLLFDTKGRGYIRKKDVSNTVKEQEGAGKSAASSFLSEDRWNEMDWDQNGSITFEEFVYAFTRWVDIDNEDEDEFDQRASCPKSRRKSSLLKMANNMHLVPAKRRNSSSAGMNTSRSSAKIHAFQDLRQDKIIEKSETSERPGGSAAVSPENTHTGEER